MLVGNQALAISRRVLTSLKLSSWWASPHSRTQDLEKKDHVRTVGVFFPRSGCIVLVVPGIRPLSRTSRQGNAAEPRKKNASACADTADAKQICRIQW